MLEEQGSMQFPVLHQSVVESITFLFLQYLPYSGPAVKPWLKGLGGPNMAYDVTAYNSCMCVAVPMQVKSWRTRPLCPHDVVAPMRSPSVVTPYRLVQNIIQIYDVVSIYNKFFCLRITSIFIFPKMRQKTHFEPS